MPQASATQTAARSAKAGKSLCGPASQQQSDRQRANSRLYLARQRASQPAAVAQQASQQQRAASEPASSSSGSKPAASQSVSQCSQPASQPRAAPAASQPASRPAAEPASLSTALLFAALLCSTSPPAETRLTVCRRSQHASGGNLIDGLPPTPVVEHSALPSGGFAITSRLVWQMRSQKKSANSVWEQIGH